MAFCMNFIRKNYTYHAAEPIIDDARFDLRRFGPVWSNSFDIGENVTQKFRKRNTDSKIVVFLLWRWWWTKIKFIHANLRRFFSILRARNDWIQNDVHTIQSRTKLSPPHRIISFLYLHLFICVTVKCVWLAHGSNMCEKNKYNENNRIDANEYVKFGEQICAAVYLICSVVYEWKTVRLQRSRTEHRSSISCVRVFSGVGITINN